MNKSTKTPDKHNPLDYDGLDKETLTTVSNAHELIHLASKQQLQELVLASITAGLDFELQTAGIELTPQKFWIEIESRIFLMLENASTQQSNNKYQ